MPLIDLLRPRIADRPSDLRRPDWVVTDLGVAFGMGIDPAAEMARQHLGPEADAEKGLLLLERHRDPVGFAAHEFLRVVGARRTAEDDRAGVLRERFRERIAEAWMAGVERIAALLQGVADPTGRGAVPVQNDQDRLKRRGHDGVSSAGIAAGPRLRQAPVVAV